MKRMVREPKPAAFSACDHDLLDLLDAGHDGGELDEGGVGERGDDLGEGGFAGAGRAPEDHGGGVVVLDREPQRLAGAEQMLLADELFERVRAHALGQRSVAEGGCGAAIGEVSKRLIRTVVRG